MKKRWLLFAALLLNGCILYDCTNDEQLKMSFCMRSSGYQTLIEEGKERDYIFQVIREAGEMEKKSPNIVDKVIYPEGSFFTRKNADLDGWRKMEQEYIQTRERQIEEEKAYKKWQEEEKVYEETLKKKSGGKGWCNPKEIIPLANKGTLPKNCMFVINVAAFKVLQQTDDGTLIHLPQSYGAPFTYLITSNKIDRELVDGGLIPEGVFVNMGTYQYISALGTQKTIYRIKRID